MPARGTPASQSGAAFGPLNGANARRLRILAALGGTALVLAACDQPPGARGGVASTPESYGTAGITVGGDTFPDAGPAGETPVSVDRTSTVSLDVDTASYSYARRLILGEGRLPPEQAIRPEEWVNYFDYAYPRPGYGQALQATSWVYQAPWRADRVLVHVGVAAAEPALGIRQPHNLVVLVDVSGSMAGRDSAGLAGDVLRSLAANVSPGDQVSVVAFAGTPRTILPPTDGANRWAIAGAADALDTGGWSAGERALDHAYDLARQSARPGDVSRVLVITDGDFTDGARSPQELVAYVADRRRSGVFLSLLGVSRGGFDDAALQALAQAGNGEAAYLDDAIEAERVIEDLLVAGAPVASDARVDMEFNPALVRSWRLVGYETREISRQEFFDPRTDAAEVRPGQEVTLIYELALLGSPGPSYEGGPYRYPGVTGTGQDGAGPGGSGGFVQPYRQGVPPTGGIAPFPTPYPQSVSGELGFLRLRYRDVASGQIRETRQPIRTGTLQPVTAMPTDIRFAAAVAMAAQAARGDIAAGIGTGAAQSAVWLARGALGADPNGERSEFVRIAEAIARLAGGYRWP
ncbi:MAG: von Willebrand factor type A domain-containing protein [Azospirillaceae bacterium]